VKTSQKRRPISLFIRSVLRSRGLAVSSTATGCALLLAAAGGEARAADQGPAQDQAQAQGQEQLQEVVITGIRAGIESAIRTKEKSDLIEETISAEDIGKLPDTTIAESLARLPGVTTQRDSQGNATSVSIRGLGPDFNGYLMNGREQTSTLDSRAVDLSVYPAELIAGATVYKSGDAALMTAGLAGTIDQRLVDPLSYDHLIARGSYEADRFNEGVAGQPVGKGKRYSLSFIDQFADRKLGLAIGFVHSDHDSASLNDGTWGNANYTAISPNGTNLGMAQFAAGLNYATNNYSEKRDGGAVILKFKPNDVYTSEIDYYYAKLNLSQHITEAQVNFGGPPAVTTITNATVVNGIIDSGSIAMAPYTNGPTNPTNNANPLIDKNEVIFDQDTIESFGWNHAIVLSDDWDVSLDINHNRAQRVERDNEAYATLDAANTLSFTNGVAAVSGGIANLTLATPYTDPTQVFIHSIDGWSGVKYPSGPFAGDTVPQAGYSKGPTITDTLYAGRLDFTHTLSGNSLFSKLEFGANVSKRGKEYISPEALVISMNPGGYGDISFPGSAFVAHDVGGSGLDLLSFSPGVNLWPGAQLLPKYNDDILSKTWTVTEKVTTLYGKLDIKTEWAGIPVRGNVGVQEVFTNQSSEGYRANVGSSVSLTNPAVTLSEEGTSYADFLPSLNLTGDFGNGNLLRFAAAEQIARPDMTAMRNSLALTLDTGSNPHPTPPTVTTYNTLVGSAGNPNLKPFKATAFDLSYEKYFETKAYLSAAVFYKALNTYITQYTNFCGYDFTQLAQAVGVAIPTGPTGGCGGGALGTYTTQVNGHGGNLRGIELAASLPFNMLTSWLDGFGVTGSYSSTLSSVVVPYTIGLNPSQQVGQPNQVNLTMGLPNLSHVNIKGILYFEKWGFSAFVADNKRSQYIGTVANQTVGGYPALVYIEPQRWVSAQAGYEFQSGYLKGLGIRFEGTNLNKPKYQTQQAFGGPVTTIQTGANYDLRVFYKFED
jgi:iron complex outermembrane receptor protein